VSEPAPPPAGPTRRDLLAAAAVGGAGLGCLAHGIAWLAALNPRVLYEPPSTRSLGPAARFPVGVTYLAEASVFVLRSEEGAFRALSAVCTHLGCTVSRGTAGFRCPCHGSEFDAEGRATAGPAPRALPWRPLTLTGARTLVVDLAAEVGPEASVTLGEGE
jgi:cytochrome b6-f complex iron-sulfur subunit